MITLDEFYRAYEWEPCDECCLPAVIGMRPRKEQDLEFYACWEHGVDFIVDENELVTEVAWLDNKDEETFV